MPTPAPRVVDRRVRPVRTNYRGTRMTIARSATLGTETGASEPKTTAFVNVFYVVPDTELSSDIRYIPRENTPPFKGSGRRLKGIFSRGGIAVAAARDPGNHRFCLRNHCFVCIFLILRMHADPRFSSNYPTIDDEYFFSLSETFFFTEKKSPLVKKKVPLC